jgi:type I restriction enzyme R subunit
MTLIDENMAEQASLGWFEDLGYARIFGPDIAPGGSDQERPSYKHIVLEDRLLTCYESRKMRASCSRSVRVA